MYCDAEPGSMEHLASSLFQLFTGQVWAALNSSYKSDGSLRKLSMLESALECWSFDSLHRWLKGYTLIPNNSVVRGSVAGPRAPSFAGRAELYFVKAGQDLEKFWGYLAHEPGYIAEYRRTVGGMEQDVDIDELDLGLKTIFLYCQCLPNSKLKNVGGIWEVKLQRVILLANPHYYS